MVWAALVGIGSGGGFILALSFIGLRTGSAHQTAQLSGMTQSVGYLLSACGPVAIGALHDVAGGWPPALAMCGVLCVVMAVMGLGAGRNRQITQA